MRESPTSNAYSPTDAPVCRFQVAARDIAMLLAATGGVAVDARSPLHSIEGVANPQAVPEHLLDLSSDDDVIRTLAILRKPALVIDNRIGGAGSPLSLFVACHAPAVDAGAFATFSPDASGHYLLQLFETPWQFLAWWLSLVASNADDPVPNYLPPPLTIETAVYLLHAIDLHRRKSYESLLTQTHADDRTMDLASFGQTLERSIRSKDLRWLVPAFITLVPGLSLAGIDDRQPDLDVLVRQDFVVPSATESDGPRYLVGEAAQQSGAEFLHGWTQSIGFEIAIRTGADWRVARRGFLAPTKVSNHLFLIDGDGARASVNHQSLTRDLLDRRCARLLDEMLALVDAVEQPASANPSAMPSGRLDDPPIAGSIPRPVCTSCGHALEASHRFCPECGVRVGEAPDPRRLCRSCTAPLRANARFCTACGASAVAAGAV